MSTQQIIQSVSEFVSIICEVSTCLIKNGIDLNEILLFRGHDDEKYKLLPSVARNIEHTEDGAMLKEERNLIDTARYKMPDIFKNDLSPIELLALLQHHGIYTRLLDVTSNAFVALYFACCKSPDKNGEVFTFKHNDRCTTNFPFIESIADSYRFATEECSIDEFFKYVKKQPYFLEEKYALKQLQKTDADIFKNILGVSSFNEYVIKVLSSPLFIYAPIRSLRQQIQQGLYILFPNNIVYDEKNGEECFEKIINPISKDHECIVSRIIVPSEKKTSILEELKLFGISRETLFGDNTDIVCSEIVNNIQQKIKGNIPCLT